MQFLHHQSQPQDHLCEVWQCCKQTETKHLQENNNRSCKGDDGAAIRLYTVDISRFQTVGLDSSSFGIPSPVETKTSSPMRSPGAN